MPVFFIHHHFGPGLGADFQILQGGQERHQVVRELLGHGDLDGGDVQGPGIVPVQGVVDSLGRLHGGGEIGHAQVQEQGFLGIELEGHAPLHHGPVWDGGHCGDVFLGLGRLPPGGEAAQDEGALGQGVDLAVDALEGGDQQDAPIKTR